MCVYLGKSSSSQYHAIIIAVTAHCLVFIGQNDVPVSGGGVKGEPSHCREETVVSHDATYWSYFDGADGLKKKSYLFIIEIILYDSDVKVLFVYTTYFYFIISHFIYTWQQRVKKKADFLGHKITDSLWIIQAFQDKLWILKRFTNFDEEGTVHPHFIQLKYMEISHTHTTNYATNLKFWRASKFVLQSLCHMLMPTRVIFPHLLSVAKRKQQWKKDRKGGWVGRKRRKGVGGMNSYQSENRLCLL